MDTKNTSSPSLIVITETDGHVNVRRPFDASGLDKNVVFATLTHTLFVCPSLPISSKEIKAIHNKRKKRLVQPTVEKVVRTHDNLVLRKTMM
jgi:hypothetical protein